MAYQVQVMSSYVRGVPPEKRGQAIGIGASGLMGESRWRARRRDEASRTPQAVD